MAVNGRLGNRKFVGMNCMEYMLSGANGIGYDLFIAVEIFSVQRNTLSGLDQYCLIFGLCIFCDVDSAWIDAAAVGAFGASVADKGSFHEQRTAFVRFDESILVHCRMLPDFSGNSCGIFSDSLSDSLECHSLAEAFLNLNSIL